MEPLIWPKSPAEMKDSIQNQQAPKSSNICAIVVTYFPDEGLYERLKCIAKQVDKVVIVDNHSSESYLDMIKKVSSHVGAHLIVNDDNLGVATALNQGIRYAESCGYIWALLLDQDTIPLPEMIQILISAYQDCSFKEKVGVIASNYLERQTKMVLLNNRKQRNCSWKEVKMAINSGSLLSIPIFEKIGPFRDDFFISAEDLEYCLRVRANGYKVIIATKIGMTHSLGNSERHSFFWWSFFSYHYPAQRYYYKARNNLLLIREYFFKEIDWVWALNRLPIKDCLKIILYENDKILKLKYLCLGVYHALLSKTGKISYKNG